MLQEELSTIFQRDLPHLLKGDMVTVTRVEVSPDLSVAKASLAFMLAPNKQEILDKINDHKSEVRGILGRRIAKAVRRIPELIFILNESADYASHMDRLISSLDIPEAPEEDKEEEEDEDY